MAIDYYGLNGACENAPTRPTLPEDFAASGTDNTHIVLTWTEVDDPDAIQIEWSESDADYAFLTELYPGEETYSHAGRTADTEYFYRLRVHLRSRWSDYVKANATTTNT